jgi:putative ABC transport system ATP-binding protein
VVRELTKLYSRSDGDVRALDGVSMECAGGTSTAVMGPSGSGKSTLLSLVAGLERPTSGELHVLGQDLAALSEDGLADMRRAHIGIVFQNYHLIPTLTVCENVMLPLVPAEGMSLELRRRALTCIERVGLEQRIRHLPGELSGGEQQRVGLARALMNDPEVLLADEPTGNLDEGSAGVILDLLFGLAEGSARTIILTTHSRAVAARCQRLLRIESGLLVADG